MTRLNFKAAALGLTTGLALTVAGAVHADDIAVGPSGTAISEAGAKRIARSYLRQLGFTAPLKSVSTARVVSAELVGDEWHVTVMTGNHLPSERGLVLVNAETGAVNEGYENKD